MQEVAVPILSGWQNFFMLIGTAAATLMGLMFVSFTLVAGFERDLSTLDAGVSAFNTPTVMLFVVVLLVALILNAPWQALSSLSLCLSLVALAMLVYLSGVIRRLRHVPGYATPLRDWLWYGAFPLSAHIVLFAGALILPGNPATALSIISAAIVALLFIGVRNTWDLVTFLAIMRPRSVSPQNEAPHPEDRREE